MFSLETFLVHIYMIILEWGLVYFIYYQYKPMDPRVSKKKLAWIFLFTGLAQAFFGSFELIEVNIVVSAILYGLLGYCFFKKRSDIILAAVIATAVVDMSEGLAGMILMSPEVTRQEIGTFMSESANTMLLFTFARFIGLILVLILIKFKKIRDLNNDMPAIYWSTFLFIAMKDVLLLLILADTPRQISFYYWLAIIPILPVSYLLLFYTRRTIQNMIRTQIDSKLLDAKNQFYKQQVSTMEQTLESQKIVRHDLKNKLSPLVYLAENGKTNELLTRVKGLRNLNMMGNTYSESGNITIDYIINLKLQELENQDVTINCEVNVPTDLDIAPFDLSTVLGNLIDNVIEALTFVKTQKWVEIKVQYQKGFLIISVINPFDGTINLDGTDILTRKMDSENHGLGLNSIRLITKKYNGDLNVRYDGPIFEVSVKLLV